jgi:hypothetical protein
MKLQSIRFSLVVASVVVCMALLLSTSGCSEGNSAGAEASGVVTVDGSPVANVLVNFLPDAEGNSAFATTDASGRFRVQTTRTMTGLEPGEYQVTVHPGDSDAESVPITIPEKYQNEETSDLRVTIQDGNNDLKIELSSSGSN